VTGDLKRWEHLTHGSKDAAKPGARRRNLIALAVAVLGHVLLFARFDHAARPAPTPFSDVAGMSVSLVSESGEMTKTLIAAPSPTQVTPPAPAPPEDPKPEPVEAKPAPPTDPLLRPLPPLDLTAEPITLTLPADAAPASVAAPPAAAAAGSACSPVGALEAAVQANTQIMAEFSRVPRSAKPVADTLMVWNGRWLPIAAPGFVSTSDALRRTITGIVRALAPDCLAQPLRGPRLLLVSDQAGTTVVALGSGSWTWADLLRDPPDAVR